MSYPTQLARLLGAGVLIAAANLSGPAFAAMPEGCFSGVWIINEQLTKRARPPQGPFMTFFAPWGDNGWVRFSGINGEEREGRQSGEFQFVTFDGKIYPIYGSDPRETTVRRTGDFTFQSGSIREDEPNRETVDSTTTFSEDCARMTTVRPAGERSYSGNPDFPDIRVFDKLRSNAGSISTVYFGAWKLNRAASKLTRPPEEEETIALVPWGDNGWGYVAISGGFQPEDFRTGEIPVNAGRPFRTMYWKSWDGTPAYSHGFDPRQVRVRKIDDLRFKLVFERIHQPWQRPDRGTLTFSADGKRMTETRDGDSLINFPPNGVIPYQTDVRVYDRVEPADWPGDVRIYRTQR